MSENLILALQITVLGMGLVFLGLIIIWGVMLALTASTSGKAESSQASADSALHDLRAKAAALAVASVLAEQKQAGVSRFPIPPTALVSAWQLTMRTRQLNHEGRPKYQG